jgi:hypothetical protein
MRVMHAGSGPQTCTLRSEGTVGDKPRRARSRSEGVIPGSEENVASFETQRGREVDRVISTKSTGGGEVTGVPCKRLVDRNDAQLGIELVERCDRAFVSRFIDAAHASSRRECRTALGIDKPA